jgi:hypothetical protein
MLAAKVSSEQSSSNGIALHVLLINHNLPIQHRNHPRELVESQKLATTTARVITKTNYIKIQ